MSTNKRKSSPRSSLPSVVRGGKSVVEFDPKRYRLNDAALNYGIKEAKRIKDWPALEKAIDSKIEEQAKFVIWWARDVQRAGGDRQTEKHSPRTRRMPCAEAENLTGMSHQRVSDLGKRLRQPDQYRAKLLGAEFHAAMLEAVGNVRGTTGTGENEWYTPQEYLERARRVLGVFDLDPASSKLAQKTVAATNFFTKADDGLVKEWHGRIWLNPPYAQPLIADFVGKLIAERAARRVTAAIMLTHNYTDTAWFQDAAVVADALCFTRGRVRFVDANGGLAAPTQGQVFHYFGEDREKFIGEFAAVGFVVVRP